MPALTNVKHEKIAKALVRSNGNQTEALQQVIPSIKRDSASVAATRILQAHPEIHDRAAELMNAQGGNLAYFNEKLLDSIANPRKDVVNVKTGELISIRDSSLQLRALELGYRIHGAIKDGASVNINSGNVQNNVALGLSVDADRLDGILQDIKGVRAEMRRNAHGEAQDGEIRTIDAEADVSRETL